MSKALGLQTLGDKLVADLAASWWFLLLGLCFSFQCACLCLCSFLFYVFSFVNVSFLCLCFPFFDELGLKEDFPPRICRDSSQIFPGVLLSLVVALLWVLAMRWILNSSQLLPYRPHLPNHQQIGLFTHHWPVNQWRTETSIRSGHLDAHALMSTNSVWTCTSIAPAWTSCPTWTFCPLGQTGGPPVFPAPPQCSPGHLGVVINIVIIIILIAINSFINLCRWTAGFLVWTSMLGTMVVLTYVTK